MTGKRWTMYREGNNTPNDAFLLAYEQAVLYALRRGGLLTDNQLAGCIARLTGERQSGRFC